MVATKTRRSLTKIRKMAGARIDDAERLREFNRFYTRAIGVLNDRYLGHRRPLGASRLLFEIGGGGADVRELRVRLGLDSGYTSRLLRVLESTRLVAVRASDRDARVRTAELTAKGRRELADLDDRARAVALALLDPLSPEQRAELLAAMALIQARLRLATIELAAVDAGSAEARRCLAAYAAELAVRFPEGYDPAYLSPPAEANPPGGGFVIAREQGRAVGCVLVRTLEPGTGEIRHLWVAPAARRLGLARRLLAEIERRSLALGHRRARLDTHRVLTEAVALYRSAGYREIPAYTDDPYGGHWFEKRLG